MIWTRKFRAGSWRWGFVFCWFFFWGIIDLQYILVAGVQQCDSFVYIEKPSPQWVCRHMKLMQYYWLYSPCCAVQPQDLFIYNWKLVLFDSFYPFHLTPPTSNFAPLWNPPIWSLYLWDWVLFCKFVCFCVLNPISKGNHTLFVFLSLT